MKIKFTKMQAYGNDYVYIDAIHQTIKNPQRLSQIVSNRRFAIGSDGLVLICTSEKADFQMRMFNPDGTEAEMCGNALRSIAKYVYEHNLTEKENLTIETLGGLQHVKVTVENKIVVNISANIGKPKFDTSKIPVLTPLKEFVNQEVSVLGKTFHITAVSVGNPHAITFIDNVETMEVKKYGEVLENMVELFPNKTNVTFAQVINRNRIKIREWERGTGETTSCGTGSCATVAASIYLGLCDREVTVEQIGGDLFVEWNKETGNITMTGPAYTVFESEIEIPESEE